MGENLEPIKVEPKKNVESSGWLMDNVAHPFVNAAVIDPINAVASVSEAVSGKHLPRVDLLAVPESTGTGSWLAQTLSSGVGAIAPYVIAGKMTGSAFQSGGRLLEANNMIKTGGLSAKFLASERSAMIVGAGLYGGARDPIGGETRFGNAVGSMVGMATFEAGNSLTKGLSLSKSVPLRALVGAVGGTSQLATASLISEGTIGSTDNLMKAASSGAALNLFLPAAQHGLGRAVDAANVRMGRPIPAENFAARENWSGNEPLQDLVNRSPLTRVVRSTGTETSMNQERNVVNLGAKAGPEKLGHEISHRISNREAESDFKAAAELLKTDPEAAKQKFIDIRTAQEKAALEAESRVKAAEDYKSPYGDTNPEIIKQLRANKDTTYGDMFAKEAEQFEQSGGKFRPKADYSSPEYKGKSEGGLHLFVYEKPSEAPVTKEKVIAFERNDDASFQRWTKADATEVEGRTWGTIELFAEPAESPYGSVKRVESFPDKSLEYHIVKGEDGIPDNTVVRVYTQGLDTDFGMVTSTVTHPNGRVDYGKLDGSSATKFAEPEARWYGKVAVEDTKTDGTTFYHLTDGATVEYYAQPMKVQFHMPDNSIREVEVETAWRSNGKAQHSMVDKSLDRPEVPTQGEPVPNSVPQKSEYLLTNESTLEQVSHTGGMEIVERPYGGTTTAFSPKYIVENYPKPILTPEGPVNRVVRTFDSTIYNLADGSNTKVQVYNAEHVRPTEFGDVNRVVYSENGYQQMTKTDGNMVLTNSDRLLPSDYGEVKAHEHGKDGTRYYHRENGSVVEQYPSQVSSSVGPVEAIEATQNGLILYRPLESGQFRTLELDFVNKRSTASDAQGNVIPNGYQPLTDFLLLRKFMPADYPDGKLLPQGKVRSIETDANGKNTYQLVDGTTVKDS